MKRKKIFAWLLAASLLLTAGCSKKVEKIKTVEETQTEVIQLTEKQDDFAQFRTEKTWDDDLQGAYKGKNVDVSLYAYIDLPEITQSVVVEGKYPKFSEEYKESVLKGICEGEDIYYYDMAHHTTEELQEQMDYIQESLFSENDEEKADKEKQLKELQKYLDSSSNEYTKATDFHIDNYIIKRNDDWYEVSFNEQDTGNQVISFSMVEEYKKGPEGLWKYADGVSFIHPSHPEEEDNLCKFNREEAEEEALSFAGKMGMDNLVSMEIVDLLCIPYYDDMAAEEMDGFDGYHQPYGYDILMGAGVNDEFMFESQEDEGFVGSAMVTDEGVVRFQIKNPIEQTRVSEHVSLLSLDKIKTAFKKELTQNLDFYCSGERKKFKFDTLKLQYLWSMKDASTGEGAYIPVWVLKDTSMEPEVRIYVNAIDGTVLDTENLR